MFMLSMCVCNYIFSSLFAYNYITSSQQSSVIYYNYSLYMTFMKQYIVSFCFRSKLVPFTCLSCPDASYSHKRRALWQGGIYNFIVGISPKPEYLFLPGLFCSLSSWTLEQLGSYFLLFRSNWWQIHISLSLEPMLYFLDTALFSGPQSSHLSLPRLH